MSIKSLLQIILLLLIFLIIGGIYFFYFYSGDQIRVSVNANLDQNNDQIINQNLSSVENVLESNKLEEGKIFNNTEYNHSLSDKVTSSTTKKVNIELKTDNTNNLKEEIENITKDIEYITSNSKGDIFKIIAKFGKTNAMNSDILDLNKVYGTISSTERSQIFIESEYSKYNYTNQNSKFYKNVVIKFENKIITCDNLDLNVRDNIAIAYGNVIVKDDKSVMKAQTITMDTITKDIKINSNEKVEIFTN